MIDGVKVIERLGDKGELIKYTYKGYSHWCKGSSFYEMTKDDFEKEYCNAVKIHKEIKEVKKKIRNKPITDFDKALFERWQSETGYDDEKED